MGPYGSRVPIVPSAVAREGDYAARRYTGTVSALN
jgi:hypothetical protein